MAIKNFTNTVFKIKNNVIEYTQFLPGKKYLKAGKNETKTEQYHGHRWSWFYWLKFYPFFV